MKLSDEESERIDSQWMQLGNCLKGSINLLGSYWDGGENQLTHFSSQNK